MYGLVTPSRQGLVLTLVVLTVGGLVFVGGATAIQETATNQTTAEETPNETATPGNDTAAVRLVHASPDAPAVDVYVDGEPAVENLTFGNASEYLTLDPGTYNVTITAAGDPDTVVFEEDLPVESGQYTVAAAGEVSTDGEQPFAPVVFVDDAAPAEDEALVSVAHLSPDAPPVDVTVAESGEVLVDNASYGNATDYASVPPGNYTLEVRAATPDNDGTVVQSVEVSVTGETAYTAIATGYVEPGDAATDQPFEVVVLEDATANESDDYDE